MQNVSSFIDNHLNVCYELSFLYKNTYDFVENIRLNFAW